MKAEFQDYLKSQCNFLLYGQCQTAACVKGQEHPPSCVVKRLAEALDGTPPEERRHEPKSDHHEPSQ